jgi:hypothetical protein
MPDSSPILIVEWVRPEGVRLLSADRRPFDLPRSALEGEPRAGDLVRLLAVGCNFIAVPAPGGGAPSTFDEILNRR